MAQTKIEQGLLKFTEATDYLKIPTGTTAQRPSSPEAGYIRFNTTISKFEIYNGTDWTEPGVNPPTVTSLDYPATKTALDPAGGETLLINGTNFQAGITVDFGGTAATSITINSSTQLSVVAPAKAAGNVTLTITNTDTGSVQTTVVYNALPTWTTAAGSLGNVAEGGSISFTVAASESDSGAITYSITSGSLPTGASLNSSTGAITGTAPSVSADTTYNFTITATDDENQTASRAFSITVIDILPSTSFGTILYEGDGTSGHSINGGKFGAGAYFKTNGNVESSAISSQLLNDYSISFWFYLNNIGSLDGIMGFYTYNTNDGMSLAFANGNLLLNTGDGQAQYAPGSPIFSAGQWYHVVITLQDGSNMKLYIDGSLQTTLSSINNSATSSSTLKFGLGSRTNSGLYSYNQYLDGKIDQARVFTKELSSSEVTTLYSETASTVESLDPLSEDTTGTLQVLGDSSCLAAYQFENDETDLSGNYNGVGTKIQYGAGRYGQAASFNGGSSYVTIPSSTNPLGFINNNFSYSLWVNATSGGEDDIIGNWDTGSSSNNHFLMLFNGRLRMHLKGAGVGDSTGLLSTNRWYHIVCTTDWTNGEFKYYINGSLDSTKTISTTAHSVSAANNLYIGTRSGGSPNFGGRIDQVRIFNKVLSAAEVTTLYNENSLIASYRFEGNAEDDTRNYDGTATNVTYEYGLSFTPDFVWVKARDAAYSHNIQDSSRGGGSSNTLNSNVNVAAGAYGIYGYVNSFDTGGFTVNAGSTNSVHVNNNGTDYVAFCLKANGGTTSSNTNGSITSTVQKNSNDSFSIITYTGNGTSGATVGHGLSVAPELLLFKRLNAAESWNAWASAFSSKVGFLNTDDTFINYSVLATNTSTITLNNGTGHNASAPYVCYAFASVSGFSKINSYTGNGSSQLIETGFEPAFVIIKSISAFGDWRLYDNKRGSTDSSSSYVGNRKPLYGNLDIAEGNGVNEIRFLSTGFEVGPGNNTNTSGVSFIYMAFAADPDTVVPTKAKSFSTVTYTGTGTNQKVEGLGFAPNLVWIKSRSTTNPHVLHDTVRGIGNVLYSNLTNAEADESAYFTSVGYDYLQFGTNAGNYNNTGTNYVAWAWKADDNEPTINTDGSIDSLVSVNANAGFSIVKYAGNGTAGATIGHGLSQTPELLIVKNLDILSNWLVYHKDMSADPKTDYLLLNTTDSVADLDIIWNDTAPTSSVFSVGTSSNTNGLNNLIAYCFHSVSGFSKIGSYTGNAGTNAITGLGFQPDWILARRTDSTDNWAIIDSVREAYSIANLTDTEGTYNWFAFTSDGFTLSTSTLNASGGTYIYAAFKIN
jgi:hypothetical protein